MKSVRASRRIDRPELLTTNQAPSPTAPERLLSRMLYAWLNTGTPSSMVRPRKWASPFTETVSIERWITSDAADTGAYSASIFSACFCQHGRACLLYLISKAFTTRRGCELMAHDLAQPPACPNTLSAWQRWHLAHVGCTYKSRRLQNQENLRCLRLALC